jgi:predicted nucleic acid-binding protein
VAVDVHSHPEQRIRKGLSLQLMQFIRIRGHIVAASPRLDVYGDPDDNFFLEYAARAGADYLITGNSRHFPKFWKKTKIISAREFISLAAPHLFP